MIDPSGFRQNNVRPSVRIESVVYLEAPQGGNRNNRATRHIAPFPETLVLPAGSRAIEIHYTAPSFTSPEKVRFQTSLDGQEVDWGDVGTRRIAYLDEMKPGHHVFRVRAANEDGLWSDSSATLMFSVLPLFWQTKWFQALIIAGIFGLGLLWAYQYKVALERKQASQEAFTRQLIESQEQERNRVASELHDGLGQDLLVMKNRLRMLAEGASPEVSGQLLEISSSTSQAISEVRKISHALRPTALEQVGLTKGIEWMVEQIAQTSAAKYSTELENIDGLLSAGMEINLYRILQEALNNVMKHSQATEVIVELRKQPKAILASVFDNGRGFDVEHMGRKGQLPHGFGFSSMKERSNVLGGQLEFRSAEGKGTRLTLIVPFR
jgi:signal transduction histidine kinase